MSYKYNEIIEPINNIDNMSKYCMLIPDSLNEDDKIITIKYIDPVNNTISKQIFSKDKEVPLSIYAAFIDSKTKDIKDKYSSLPSILINTPCKLIYKEIYEKLYPEKSTDVDGIIKRHSKRSRKSKSKSKRKSKRSKSKRYRKI